MKAAVWYGERDIRVQERQLKELSSDDVKVKVAWAGICGSDLHAYLHPDSEYRWREELCLDMNFQV